MTDRTFSGAITVGLILTAVGLAALQWLHVGTTNGRLILCSGIGILLGAFGSTATVRYKGATVAGVAAIVIVLLLLLTQIGPTPIVKKGHITGDGISRSQIEIVDTFPLLGSMRGERYVFVVTDPLERNFFDIYVTFLETEDTPEQELHFLNIPKKHIEDYLQRPGLVEWKVDRENGLLLDMNRGGEPIRELSIADVAPQPTAATARASLTLLRGAFAQEAHDLRVLLADLRSDVPTVRRSAREELANRGPAAVAEMIDEMRLHRDNYRTRLGVIVALQKMLQQNRGLAESISRALSTEDLRLMEEAARDPDPTIRMYATQFLRELSDSRVES